MKVLSTRAGSNFSGDLLEFRPRPGRPAAPGPVVDIFLPPPELVGPENAVLETR
jgi:hypothetical protein